MLSDFPMAPKLAQGSLHGASLSLSQLENFSQHEKLRAVLQAGGGEGMVEVHRGNPRSSEQKPRACRTSRCRDERSRPSRLGWRSRREREREPRNGSRRHQGRFLRKWVSFNLVT